MMTFSPDNPRETLGSPLAYGIAAEGKPVAVVGGGFAGLTLAYFLNKIGFKVTVFEKSPRCGGLLQSVHSQWGLSETAANGVLWSSRVQAMCDEIGIHLVKASRQSRARWIFSGRPTRWPLGLKNTFILMSRILMIRLFKRFEFAPRNLESVATFSLRVFSREILECLLEPALGGIYAGDVNQLSARLIFSRFFRTAKNSQRNKKVVVSSGGTVAPQLGMGQWILALENHLRAKGVVFRMNTEFDWQEEANFFSVCVCTAAWQAAEILQDRAPDVAKVLAEIEPLPLVSVTQWYEKDFKILSGFGCLFSKPDRFRALGVLFNSTIFPGRSPYRSETWILGGAFHKDAVTATNEQIKDWIREDRKRIYAEDVEPVATDIYRWPKAIPHYTVSLEEKLAVLENQTEVLLHGNYMGKIGLSQIVDRSSELAAALETRLANSPKGMETQWPSY